MKIDNNHRFSGIISLNIIIILMLNFSYISDSKANDTPLSVKIDHVTCYGKSNGSIVIIPTSEISASFTIEVRSNLKGSLITYNEASPKPFQITELKAGEYTIWYSTSTKKESIPVTIHSPEALKANKISIESIKGKNESLTVSLKANPNGGTEPYSVIWSENTGSQMGAIIHDVSMGVYKCTIDDANKCGKVTATFFLYEPEIEKYKNETSK